MAGFLLAMARFVVAATRCLRSGRLAIVKHTTPWRAHDAYISAADIVELLRHNGKGDAVAVTGWLAEDFPDERSLGSDASGTVGVA